MNHRIRKFENLHILLWIIKDVCWVSDFKLAGMIMIVPTVSVAIIITIMHRREFSELIHNLAVCCWLFANITWMIGEFYFDDSSRPIAIIFFTIGLILLAYYYLIYIPFIASRK